MTKTPKEKLGKNNFQRWKKKYFKGCLDNMANPSHDVSSPVRLFSTFIYHFLSKLHAGRYAFSMVQKFRKVNMNEFRFVILSFSRFGINKIKTFWNHAELTQEENSEIGKSRSTPVEAKKNFRSLFFSGVLITNNAVESCCHVVWSIDTIPSRQWIFGHYSADLFWRQ